RLDRVTPSPAVFDMEKLYWLNRHYIKASRVDQIADLAAPFFVKAGLIAEEIDGALASTATAADIEAERHHERAWFRNVVELLAPSVDRLDQLPERAALLFHYNAQAALAAPENAEVFAWAKTHAVISAFAECVLAEPEGGLTAERFKAIMNQLKAETGAKGKELFHPVRIVVTGAHSGPEFDKLIPIIEAGSKLALPVRVKSVRQRVQEFLHHRGAGERSSG
ncbi:MAG TPA: glutamate--tRNA ligase, partial [Terriglobales bacterium]|nr:glutamate--tRNA ligase [Terriglobales bacterium]